MSGSQKEPIDRWLIRSLARFWVVGVIVVWAFAWADWNSEESVPVNLIILPLATLLLWGFLILFLLSLSTLLYLGAVAVIDGDFPQMKRRLVAVVASPLVGFPWWFWAWAGKTDDPGFVVFLAVICLIFGLTVPLRRFRASFTARRDAPKPLPST